MFINVPGLHTLITRSKLPEAVRFTEWIYEEFLLLLRGNRSYVEKFMKILEETVM